MVERVSFSSQEQSLEEIATHHADVQAGLFEFFAGSSQALLDRYADAKIDEARDKSLSELDFTSSLSVLSSVEAAVRLDYLRRVYGRWRDPLSRAMKVLHRRKENRARLEDELIHLWSEQTGVRDVLLSELVGAFNYRHWLAHGRYWTPKFGRRYDYQTVYEIAQEFIDAMDEYNTTCDLGKRRVT
jgi:hypothetical protein